MKRTSGLAALLLALALTLSPILSSKPAQAQGGGGTTTTTPPPVVLFGALTNFDVLNDTGQETYGFEIELDGIQVQDVGGTYTGNRYGTPAIVAFPGGVYVRS
ncbi:MAG TPA: hypothetical protein VFC63_14645 [Blastocatellia bacterium]|nr:hypothetical protein [Blastocatellia bacterium]